MLHLPFTKMQGLGNDFVILDELDLQKSVSFPEATSDFAKKICHRRYGVGADQLLWLKKPQDSSLDARMEVFNSDGSIAEMCGNGIRAVALYLSRYGSVRREEYRIETLAGIKTVQLQGNLLRVDMGLVLLGSGFGSGGEPLRIQDQEFRFYEVNLGNPHAVFFVKNLEQFPAEQLGPRIEHHPRFPHRTNVEFVEVLSRNSIEVRVWERGAGITLACGTGACAAAVASLATSQTHGEVDVKLPGGSLKISWEGINQPVFMKGPAQEVFQGVFLVE